VKGLDEDWSKVDPAIAYADGYRFTIGYVSQDATGKNLTRSDIDRLHAAGLAVAFVYEYGVSQPLNGYSQGVTDARIAVADLHSLGVPTGVACYVAVDFNVQPGQMSTCLAYVTGFAVTLAMSGYRAGCYTGYPFGLYLNQHNYGGFIWQTYAWSNGAWLAAAALRQTQNGIHEAGAVIDNDESETIDFGQWEPAMSQPVDSKNAQIAQSRIDTLRSGQDAANAPYLGDPAYDGNAPLATFAGYWTRLRTEVENIVNDLPMHASGLSDEDRALMQSFVDAVNTLNSHLK
jgi:Domain of unknown function (DUF1906)